jgi:hypothetical protein
MILVGDWLAFLKLLAESRFVERDDSGDDTAFGDGCPMGGLDESSDAGVYARQRMGGAPPIRMRRAESASSTAPPIPTWFDSRSFTSTKTIYPSPTM